MVEGHVPNLCWANGGYNITRVNENTWKFEVVDLSFTVTESYCYQVTTAGKKGKTITQDYHYMPLKGMANLSYVVELTKNPQLADSHLSSSQKF